MSPGKKSLRRSFAEAMREQELANRSASPSLQDNVDKPLDQPGLNHHPAGRLELEGVKAKLLQEVSTPL